MNIHIFLQKLGCTETESKVFEHVYAWWSRPASYIAKQCWEERTKVYKALEKLVKKGFLAKTRRGGVAYYYVEDISVLQRKVQQKLSWASALEKDLPEVLEHFTQYDEKRYSFAPKISLFDGMSGIENLYDDLYATTIDKWRWVITVIASNTLDMYGTAPKSLQDYAQDTFQRLKKKQVYTDILLANGISLMEYLSRSTSMEELFELPAWNSAVNFYLVWSHLYIVLFEQVPFGLKISSKAVTTMLHFLFEQLKVVEEKKWK